ncbi:MAG: nucleoside-diphosphate kinase [Candidatus Diapherotrites archaeon]|jgi:nucleoside-diphosphate kinase|nr:nucleoside-diphosphate kinase [Candidatus Diapherotrites archaeon]MBT4597076.1 nucleoside-diphosphate kinase [Candidatus Diapherotrites archaeon]
MRRTLVIVKPDGINRCLIGDVITRFEKKGLKLIGLKMDLLKVYQLKDHYVHLQDKPFYEELLEYMSSIPCVLLALEGKDAVAVVRKLVGSTNARDADIGTIRGDYAMSVQTNIVHASETEDAAEDELKRFFKDEELFEYDKMNFNWLYCNSEQGKYDHVENEGKSSEAEYFEEKEEIKKDQENE